MDVYHKFHAQVAPKYEFGYFCDRMRALSKDKTVKEHMSKIRSAFCGHKDLHVQVASSVQEEINLSEHKQIKEALNARKMNLLDGSKTVAGNLDNNPKTSA